MVSYTRKIRDIILIALTLRIAIAFLPVVPVSDCEWYHSTATSLAQGEGYSYQGKATAYHPPGYSFILSLFYRAFGISPTYGRIFNVITGTVSVIMIYLLGKRLYGSKTGLLSALILALYPEHILYSNILSPELVFSVLLLLWLLDVIYGLKMSGFISGIIISIMVYLRSNAFLLCFLPLVAGKTNWKKIFVSVCIVVICLLPWVARNKVQIRSATFATNLWVNLWIGNGELADGIYFDTKEQFENEIESENFYRNKLLEDIAKEPLRPIKIAPAKLSFFAIPAITSSYWGLAGAVDKKIIQISAVMLTLINIILLALFIIAVIRGKVHLEIAAIYILFAFTALVFFGADKFRFPVTPLLILSITPLFTKEPC